MLSRFSLETITQRRTNKVRRILTNEDIVFIITLLVAENDLVNCCPSYACLTQVWLLASICLDRQLQTVKQPIQTDASILMKLDAGSNGFVTDIIIINNHHSTTVPIQEHDGCCHNWSQLIAILFKKDVVLCHEKPTTTVSKNLICLATNC